MEQSVFAKGCRMTQAARFTSTISFGGAAVTFGNVTLLVLTRLQPKRKFE